MIKKEKIELGPPTTVRLPPALHEEVKEAAARAGHSMNDEIIARLTTNPGAVTLRSIARQNEQTHAMVQQIIDAISMRRPGRS